MFRYPDLNIKFEVKNLVRTMDFYNILLGNSATDFYEGHAVYTLKNQLTVTFFQYPACNQRMGYIKTFIKFIAQI